MGVEGGAGPGSADVEEAAPEQAGGGGGGGEGGEGESGGLEAEAWRRRGLFPRLLVRLPYRKEVSRARGRGLAEACFREFNRILENSMPTADNSMAGC